MVTGEKDAARARAAADLTARAGALRAALARQDTARREILPALKALENPEARALASELATLGTIEDALARALEAYDDALDAGAPAAADPNASPDDTQAQTFQSQKLEAIGQLTGGIAHDFNNLLTVITSGLQLLSRTSDAERRDRLTRRIEEAAWRGADLTRRLLAFARRQPLNPQRLDVAPHMEGLRELLRHGLRDDIRILTSIPDGVWPVEADLAALELAVLNLAVNARDAMPNGGTMVLGARNAGAGTLPVGLAPGDYVELFVTDTGTGMTPEVLERVFEPFFTTKPAGQGTGLGLAQVYGFARQSGGTARAESDPAQGTTVAMLLPRSVRAPEEAPEDPLMAMQRAPGPRREHLSVLVVEDDDEVASVVLEMLDQLGHRGLRVSSLPAAIAVLSGSDCIDLIFSDVLLGSSGSGLDLAREVARRNLQIPIVLTSGYGGGVTGRLAAARLPFLRKPYTIEALRSALGEAFLAEREPAT